MVQLYYNLQPLNVCLSYQGTLNLIAQLSEDHDIEVQEWADEIKNNMLMQFTCKTILLT